MIDTIVFDFGGVLIDWNPAYVYKDLFNNDDERMNWFLSNICTSDWNLEQDRGRTLAEGTALLQEKFPEHHEHIEAFYGQWPKMLGGEISETVEILKKLKQKYNLYGLTNWSAETFPVALERFQFLQLFDGIVVSGDEKMIKPDKQLFQLLLDRYHLTAANCIFIDDNQKNAEAAAELGFHAIHFTSADNLKEKLVSMNVLDAEQ